MYYGRECYAKVETIAPRKDGTFKTYTNWNFCGFMEPSGVLVKSCKKFDYYEEDGMIFKYRKEVRIMADK